MHVLATEAKILNICAKGVRTGFGGAERITGQIKAARALLEWSQSKLAAAAGLSTPTVRRLEARSGEFPGRAGRSDRHCARIGKSRSFRGTAAARVSG